jgi:hypothetical protein
MRQCGACGRQTEQNIATRVDSFPMVLELNREMTFPASDVDWRKMSVLRHLSWLGTQYKFLGVILADETEGSEHFISLVEISGNLYIHDGLKGEHLRPTDQEEFSLSAAIPAQSNIRPRRFYYVKVKEEATGKVGWTHGRFEVAPTLRRREFVVVPDDNPHNMDVDNPGGGVKRQRPLAEDDGMEDRREVGGPRYRQRKRHRNGMYAPAPNQTNEKPSAGVAVQSLQNLPEEEAVHTHFVFDTC